MPAPPLVVQTTMPNCSSAARSGVDEAFTSKAIHSKTTNGPPLLVLSNESWREAARSVMSVRNTELLERIAHHREGRDDARERRSLVSTLCAIIQSATS